jgi:hypothetical protein
MLVTHLYIIHPVALHKPINYQLNTSCAQLTIDWPMFVIQECDFDLGSGFAGEVIQFGAYDQ